MFSSRSSPRLEASLNEGRRRRIVKNCLKPDIRPDCRGGSGEQLGDDFSAYVGQAEIAALEPEGKLEVV